MLELKNVQVTAGEFSLKNVSLTIEKGSYHAIIGPSGSGKTMLLNAISGFQSLNSGCISFNGTDITFLPPEKRGIAYLFQDLALFPHLTVFNNVAYPLRSKKTSKAEIAKKVGEYLDYTGISHLAGRNIEKLSGGEKQRVALSRILVTGSPLIMLDEPFSAIDSQLKPEMRNLLKKISKLGITMIHVTHDMSEIQNLADSLTVIENGQIVQNGEIFSVLENSDGDFVKSFTKQI